MMLVFLSSFSLYYLNEEENARVMRFVSFLVQKNVSAFFSLFFGLFGFLLFVFFLVLDFFLSFLHHSKKEAFLRHSVLPVCILSPLPFLLFARRRERFTF